MFIDLDGILVSTERHRIAKQVVIFIRKPPFLSTFEATVYPLNQPLQNFIECDAIWTWEHFGAQDAHLLEVLTKKPVFRIPFTWSSKAVEAHGVNHPSWLETSKKSDEWVIHFVETNASVSSNCTLPIVGVAYAKTHSKMVFNHLNIHNGESIKDEPFFKDNVLAHSQRDGLDITFVGRMRCTDFRVAPKSVVVSHIRFMAIKNVLLDCVWNGIPTVHNSPFLKDLGFGLERYYYPDNSVVGMNTALNTLVEDYTTLTGIFAPGRLEEIRLKLTAILDPIQHREKWERAFGAKAVKKELIVGFSDLWDDANPEYNFWTLLLNEAGSKLSPPVSVRGVRACTTMDILLFGPFGSDWKQYPTIPKFHITGENSQPIPDVMNFGFKPTGPNSLRFPLWMQYIDWFGADQERLVNPKTMPIDSVCTPYTGTKSKFCAFVVSNPSNTMRNEAFHCVSQYKQVDSAGRLFNNVGPEIFTQTSGGGTGELKKLKFLQDYKFCLAYENNRADGYVTEKLLAAKAAGCIPIYWGAEDVENDFPAGSFINANSYNPAELLEEIRKVDTDDSLWSSIASKVAVSADTVRRKLSEVAKAVLSSVLESERFASFPSMIGASTTAEAMAMGKARGDIIEGISTFVFTELNPIKPKLAKPKMIEWNRKTLLVSFATQKYIEPLLKWILSVNPRLNEFISARVYLGHDVGTQMVHLLQSQNPSIEFYTLPSFSVAGFPDIWDPQTFAWKLWIYQELVQEEELCGMLVWYMDCASIIVRWPTDWFAKAIESGLCMLEDPQQKNDQWCHPTFCQKLVVTPQELAGQQVVGGIMAFVGGAVLPWKVFVEAWVLGQQREIIVGPKWAGVLADGRPYGHRHDQSILSLLRIRRNVPMYPLYSVYCDESLRRTFKSGACLYIHRGDFKEHVEFAPRIGEVHIINLARRGDRIKKFKEAHEPWTKTVCLRPAYDGRELKLTPALARLFAPNDFFWKKAVMGCALSHLSLWTELASETSCENYLILEDDVLFKKGWMNVWAEASKHIPEDYDVLYLGGVLPPNKEMYEKVLEPVNSFWGQIIPNRIFGQSEDSTYFHFCNYSYILSRKGAQKILAEIQTRGGYYTSADHMVCNRTDMKLYMLHPLVSGCYQDNDPKYAKSEFNNFNRVDAFDSDLWNNDERFSEDEIGAMMPDAPISISQALMDGRQVVCAVPFTGNRIFTVGDHALVKGSLYEYEWLETLLGDKFSGQQQIPVNHEPLDTQPIFICMKPYLNMYMQVFERYHAAGKKFFVIHLSDEHGSDPIQWYSSCEHVFRMYVRPDTLELNNVTHIPLGPHRTSKHQKELIKRRTIWSFYGTGWNEREARMQILTGVQPAEAVFYESWADKKQLGPAEYSEKCLNSVFMPCPAGQNVETFRFYEALDHGCIPVYINENSLHTSFLNKHLPLMVVDSWENGLKSMVYLLQNQEMLVEYRMKLLTAWETWKQTLRKEMKSVLLL
jgi:GR25 family glycosyltransferase involved in LPS biosynthesis